jgi:hypothetical protein
MGLSVEDDYRFGERKRERGEGVDLMFAVMMVVGFDRGTVCMHGREWNFHAGSCHRMRSWAAEDYTADFGLNESIISGKRNNMDDLCPVQALLF